MGTKPGRESNNMTPGTVITGDGATQPSFDDLYRRRAADALRYAASILGSEDAGDACQEAWLKVWRSWGAADPEHLDAWVIRIVRNCCIDQQRARRPVDHLDERDLPPVMAADDAVAFHVDATTAMPLLRQLGQPFREALWLREVADLSCSEIAEIQGVPIGTVMSRLHAARRKAAYILRKERW